MVDKSFGPRDQGAQPPIGVVFTQARFDEFPDLWVSDTSFRDMKKVSNANPQQSEYAWGKAELMHYINADGKTLRAILAKPDNFDPAKKYPLMVYIYEELSEGLHSYRAPNPGHEHQHHALRQQRLRRADARHRLRDRLSRGERGEVRHPGRQHGRRAGLHRPEAGRHPGPLVGRLPDHAPHHPHQHVRRRAGRRVRVEHDQRLRRHPLGHRHVARLPVPRRRRAASACRPGTRRSSSSRTRRSSGSRRCTRRTSRSTTTKTMRCRGIRASSSSRRCAASARRRTCSSTTASRTACASATTRSTGPSTRTSSSTTSCSVSRKPEWMEKGVPFLEKGRRDVTDMFKPKVATTSPASVQDR